MFSILKLNIVQFALWRIIMNQKDKIIQATTELINENQGDLNLVTARKIADKAEVGLGLINYHFGSKDQLITECVQRIIKEQIIVLKPSDSDVVSTIQDDKQRLISWSKQVFEFLYTNRSICGISILGDMHNNEMLSNSVYTQLGLEKAIQSDMDEHKKKQIIFVLVSTMQGAFMQDNVVKNRLGYDLSNQEEREQYIEALVDLLFAGV